MAAVPFAFHTIPVGCPRCAGPASPFHALFHIHLTFIHAVHVFHVIRTVVRVAGIPVVSGVASGCENQNDA